MRLLEVSTLSLVLFGAALLWLLACTPTPRTPATVAGGAAGAAGSSSPGSPASPAAPGAGPSAAGGNAAAFSGTGSPGAGTAPAAAPPNHRDTAAGAGPGGAAVQDPHSFARPSEAAVDHLVLDLTVDFNTRRLTGRASLRLRRPTGGAGATAAVAGATGTAAPSMLVLDTRDLDIRQVTLDDGATPVPFTLGDPVTYLGRPLSIPLAPGTRWVNVDYATSETAGALQWLTPAQAGSTLPFLFTQSQTILARTWVPCQDTPGVRQTYEATIRVPPGFLAVMSAENPTARAADGVYHFRMPQPIPSYLLALAVGDLAFKPLDHRSGVYALPGVIERAAWELADTPRMIDAAEKLYGPYRWGRYDLLVLPASYPYGGMENPRLTFATPTILAGDRSLVSLVAHELAHSWSGNLVTNATWNDFWLNEGFTVFFERRIMEALYGREHAEMLAVLGRQSLDETLRDKGEGSPDTRLRLDLAGRDPDEAASDIAYEKGALLLATIEASVGRPRFDRFLRDYFDAFAFQSMDTRRFVAYLREHLLDSHPGLAESLRLDEWIDGPGLPATAITVHAAAFARVHQVAAAFAQGTPAARLDTAGWTTQHWLRFLHDLPAPLNQPQMSDLDAAFRFTTSGNDEILAAWLQLAIRYGYRPADAALDRFLITVGRRKFVQPLYTELARTPAGAETALRIYVRARPGYHPVTQTAIDKVLDWRG